MTGQRPSASAQELRLGTRGSQLALWQAHAVAARISETGGPPCRIVVIKTAGDRLQEASLSEVGGKRLFVKEIEEALLRRDIDLAVHSSKDMPVILPDGLMIGAVLSREDPLDAIVLPASKVRLKPDTTDNTGIRPKPDATRADPSSVGSGFFRTSESSPVMSGFAPTSDSSAVMSGFAPTSDSSAVVSGFSRTFTSLEDLIAEIGQSPLIGTSSVRRSAQLVRLVPGARFVPMRGNLDTRLRKLDHDGCDAIVLAAAGLRRLGFASRISLTLPAAACIPAPGQGIVAIEIRTDDPEVARVAGCVNDPGAAAALDAERALVMTLGGGCQTPIGALASPVGDELEIVAAVVSLDGSRAVHARGRGPGRAAASLGSRVAHQLMADGAGEILAEARSVQGQVEGIQP